MPKFDKGDWVKFKTQNWPLAARSIVPDRNGEICDAADVGYYQGRGRIAFANETTCVVQEYTDEGIGRLAKLYWDADHIEPLKPFRPDPYTLGDLSRFLQDEEISALPDATPLGITITSYRTTTRRPKTQVRQSPSAHGTSSASKRTATTVPSKSSSTKKNTTIKFTPSTWRSEHAHRVKVRSVCNDPQKLTHDRGHIPTSKFPVTAPTLVPHAMEGTRYGLDRTSDWMIPQTKRLTVEEADRLKDAGIAERAGEAVAVPLEGGVPNRGRLGYEIPERLKQATADQLAKAGAEDK